jgi:2-amino-4-hydroxy-6-hydroxymethyldihydropteridine diphosphokinase
MPARKDRMLILSGRRISGEMSALDKNVYVGVGSNIDPERHIVEALVRLRQRVRVTATSTFYWTAAVGPAGQPRFLNGIWPVATDLPARELKLEVLRGIEAKLGRTRTADKYAPRTIDLDIVLYGDEVIDEPDLRVPDPDIRKRAFIAVPLLELAPNLVLPDTGDELASLAIVQERRGLDAAGEFSERLRALLGR